MTVRTLFKGLVAKAICSLRLLVLPQGLPNLCIFLFIGRVCFFLSKPVIPKSELHKSLV